MLGKLLTPFTTATATGVAVRDITVMVGAALTVLGILGFLTPEQIAELKKAASPELFTALGVLMAGGMSIYRALFKSTSDKAAEAAKMIDAKVPAASQVVIKTPVGEPDIVVAPK